MATSTLGSGTLVLAGTTSGTTTVTATAVAGTTTLTLPAATDTLVGKATTDTLTNKTLTGAAMNGTLGATTPSTVAATSISASTTLGVTGVSTLTGGAVIEGLTVGKGAGAVATNTAVGASALALNTSGSGITAIGYQVLYANTTGVANTAVGGADGVNSIPAALTSNSTGSYNVGVGTGALKSNTIASNNTAVGYQAGYTNIIGTNNTYTGWSAGKLATGNSNTAYGSYSAYSLTTGSGNTFYGTSSGGDITTGAKNTIIGSYGGNQGGLDIRTASNYIVLSDGDGNPRGVFDNSGNFLVGGTSGSFHTFVKDLNGNAAFGITNSGNSTPNGVNIQFSGATPNNATQSFLFAYDSTSRAIIYSNGGLANYSANNSNLSDRREKTNFAPAGSYLDKICAIPVQTFNYIDQNMEDDGGLTLGVVAQDVQAVAPEMVMESNWGTENEPKMRLSIYQTDLQYALMKCIQELKAEVDSLKAQINGASA